MQCGGGRGRGTGWGTRQGTRQSDAGEAPWHQHTTLRQQYSPSPPLPHPLTPCLPGHPETVSEEFNGGPLVINPLPAGSSTSFGVNVGI